LYSAGSAEKTSVNSIDKMDKDEEDEDIERPTRPLIPGNMIDIVNMFLGGASRPRPKPTKAPTTTTTTTKPKNEITKKQDELLKSELQRPKDFVDVILEVIRPVFISILGRVSIMPGSNVFTRKVMKARGYV